MRRMTVLFAALMASACSTLPLGGSRENVYELQRQALAAYDGDEDAKAETLFLALLRTSPNDAATWFYLGNLYARSNRPDQAVDAYQKSLMLNANDARPWHNLGVIRLRQARASFIQAFELTGPEQALHGKAEAIVGAMEKLPLDSLRARPRASAGAGDVEK